MSAIAFKLFLLLLLYLCYNIADSIAYIFYGDQPFEDYLRKLCHKLSQEPTSRFKVLLADQLQLSWPDRSNHHLFHFLTSLNCVFVHYPNKSLHELALELSGFDHLHYELIAIIDFTSVQVNVVTLEKYLTTITPVYTKCHYCLPFILIFDLTFQVLQSLLRKAFPRLNNNLRLTLLSNQSTSVLHLRPILDGCRIDNVILQPTSAQDFARLRTLPKQCNLAGGQLKVGVNHLLPFCNINFGKDGRPVTAFSIELQLLTLLKNKFCFEVNYVDGHRVWGALENHSWTGLVGMILNQTVDLAICAISRTAARLDVVDFTRHTMVDEIIFITASPRPKSRKAVALSPFTPLVWLLNLLSFLVMSFLLYLSYQLFNRYGHGTKPIPFIRILRYLFASFLRQPLPNIRTIERVSYVSRYIFSIWILSGLVLSTTYMALFFSILTVPQYEPTIDSIGEVEQAIRYNTHRIFTLMHSSYYSDLINSRPEAGVFHLLGSQLNRTKNDPVGVNHLDLLQAIVNRPHHLLVYPRFGFDFLWKAHYGNRPVHMGRDSIGIDHLSIMLPKKSPLLLPFNLIITRIHEIGLMQYWTCKSLASLPFRYQTDSSRSSSATLRFSHLSSAFLAWIIGVTASLVIFAIELILFNYKITSYYVASTSHM